MIIRKLPVLKKLPVEESTGQDFLCRLKQRIKENNFVKNFSWQKVLEKILARTEKQTNCWLKKLKKRSATQANYSSDDYWQELKESTRLADSIAIEEEPESEQAQEVKIKVKTRKSRARRRSKIS